MPHLGAAYNLARWLVHNDHDAEDMVQEAYLRAFKFFGGYYGGDFRAWLLTIVRNTCYTWLQQNRRLRQAESPCVGRPIALRETTRPRRWSAPGVP